MTWKKRPQQKPPSRPADADSTELSGVVEGIVFRSEETGYTVCRVQVQGEKDPVTLVGSCSSMWQGENVKADGHWIRHPQHGFQFQADAITCIAPTSSRGIERYLASGMIRGIGKELASRLVALFGEETLRIIEKESKRLEEVEGIGRVRRQRIKESWNEQKGVRDIMIFLQGHGIGTAQSARIYRHYGNESVALIRQNPYRLCEDVWGIGFKTADGVAMSMGIPEDSEVRARAGLVYLLRTMTDQGHCYVRESDLLLHTETLLSIPVEILAEALKHQIHDRYLVKEEDRIYLRDLFEAEQAVAEKIHQLQSTPVSFKPIRAPEAVAWAGQRIKIQFDPSQGDALETAITEKVAIITGGPGVGKTTIIQALVEVFCAKKLGVHLSAPTGRAAKRMEEATHHDAKTIHRTLKYLPRTGKFEFGPDHLLKGDVFIVDEVSMIDIRLMAAFLGALPASAKLILVGDIDQLPSVGPGNVLRDLIQSRVVPSRALETIFRQKMGGAIVRNAHLVNRGEPLEIPAPGDDSDFYFVEADEPDLVIQRMLSLVTDRIPKRFGFNAMTDLQILTPMRRNQLGADNLNAVLQDALNPAGRTIERFGRKFRQGDRVMQIRNNYDKEIFNGDIGWIKYVDTEDQVLSVNIDGRTIRYEFSELDELVHAYACSIHKSQGSEYPAVIILMTTQHFKLLQRNLLYTAITRGKKLVCLVGTKKAIWIATQNNEIQQRQTGLKEKLKQRG